MSNPLEFFCGLVLEAQGGPMRFCFDIDGVLMTGPTMTDHDYTQSTPIWPMIHIVNWLHKHGHYIILHTARGGVSGKNWEEQTKKQLCEYGIPCHELIFGKPAADVYIDDRGMAPETLKSFMKLVWETSKPGEPASPR